jgi:hypothetical protein
MVKTLAVLTLVAALTAPAPRAAALEVGDDLLALVAMPLAVAAVSEMTNVPASDLMDVVSLLNDAKVSPVQFVEVVRYVPVALVAQQDTQPRFVDVLREREQSGLQGTELVTFIEDQFQTKYDMPSSVDLDVTRPRVDVIDEEFVPAVVRTRVAQARLHPHGGPPGQLKKQLGVQTGAEVIHGSLGRHHERTNVVRSVEVERPIQTVVVHQEKEKHEGKHENGEDRGEGHGHGEAHGGGHGHGKGKGKG